ncbi:MFS transporter [Patulibacter minatonensis]|uniref:MFS transporter n=1 Tax=Patulibacter minatonensis TaxID=298163 RepID=UPI00055B10E8|nr:MFS transporter [Patulibacter minatonensis]
MTPLRSRGDGATGSNAVLALIVVSYLMIILDASVVITALPDIQRALGFSDTGLSWVQNAYTLAFGGLLLLGARAGDILGRRRMFIWGIALFTAASFVAGLAESSTWLLIARAVQGAGAAVAAPATLSLLMVSFREGTERVRAMAAYSAAASAGGSLGLVLGGVLTTWVSWRWGLFINVPIGIAMVVLAPRLLPETPRNHGVFDLTGAITSTAGMSSLVYGFVRAASDGWGDTGTLIAFAAGVLLLAAFVRTERRAVQPITPLRLFRDRRRTGALVTRIFVVGAMFSTFFFMTQYLQGVLGYTALDAGLAFLPMTLVMFGMIRLVPRLVARFDGAHLVIAGLATALLGLAWLSRIDDGTGYLPGIAVPLVLMGTGMGIAFGPLTTAGIAGVAEADAGAASGLVNVAHQLGGSLGIGIMVTIFASASRAAAEHPVVGGPAAEARHELAHAVGVAMTGATISMALGLLIAVLVMRRPAPATAPVVGSASPAR